ncbi:hypothetical protein JB92DRAFT_736256 [Gautieria morchelliformis]|nr:hypothetical protein JB92DRAFT_736256 [Gautieria morchelliformis]
MLLSSISIILRLSRSLYVPPPLPAIPSTAWKSPSTRGRDCVRASIQDSADRCARWTVGQERVACLMYCRTVNVLPARMVRVCQCLCHGRSRHRFTSGYRPLHNSPVRT